MLTQKKTLTFNKETNNHWYLVCDEYEEKVTKEFRETFTYTDTEGKVQKYETEQDLTNPLDDHTKHPAWPSCDPHKNLVMAESFEQLLETLAKGERTVTIDVISYGWVANTYTHYHRIAIDGEGAEYELRFRNDLPQRIRLTPICRFLFDGLYPEYFHGKVIK